MRVKSNFSIAVMSAQKADHVIEIKHQQKTYLVRVLRILLPSGIEEILLTSLQERRPK